MHTTMSTHTTCTHITTTTAKTTTPVPDEEKGVRPSSYVIMGVCGCGKTTVGKALAAQLGIEFVDADDHHPEENKNKMKAGLPLDDHDRQPWLETLSRILGNSDKPVALACSALKEKYRQTLLGGGVELDEETNKRNPSRIRFVFLSASQSAIEQRLANRKGHFFNPSLVTSQFEALEPPSPSEGILTVDATLTPDDIVSLVLSSTCPSPISSTDTTVTNK